MLWPPEVKQMLLEQGLYLSISGTITDCQSQLDGQVVYEQVVHYHKNPENPGGYDINTEPKRRDFSLHRKASE